MKAWLTLAELAEYFSYSLNTTRRSVITQPDFPKPSYLTGRKAHPRWRAADVDAWAKKRAA